MTLRAAVGPPDGEDHLAGADRLRGGDCTVDDEMRVGRHQRRVLRARRFAFGAVGDHDGVSPSRDGAELDGGRETGAAAAGEAARLELGDELVAPELRQWAVTHQVGAEPDRRLGRAVQEPRPARGDGLVAERSSGAHAGPPVSSAVPRNLGYGLRAPSSRVPTASATAAALAAASARNQTVDESLPMPRLCANASGHDA